MDTNTDALNRQFLLEVADALNDTQISIDQIQQSAREYLSMRDESDEGKKKEALLRLKEKYPFLTGVYIKYLSQLENMKVGETLDRLRQHLEAGRYEEVRNTDIND